MTALGPERGDHASVGIRDAAELRHLGDDEGTLDGRMILSLASIAAARR
jgi:hypothetical protein